MRHGSLCSGYGGLEMGLMAVVGGSVAWHVEYDKHPSAVLEARFPGVPNYGDVTTTDWSQVEPVDWLTAGYPCPPFSLAGKRKGSSDERHLWPAVARAIGVLRPRRVLLENVRGHVSLGLDAVLADLARLGYDATWGVVPASAAGAPHNRARVFVVAADAGSGPLAGSAAAGDGLSVVAQRGAESAPDTAERGRGWAEGVERGLGTAERVAAAATHAADGPLVEERSWAGARAGGGVAADTDVAGPQGRESARGRHLSARGAPTDADYDAARARRESGESAGSGAEPSRLRHGAVADSTSARRAGRQVAGASGVDAGEGLRRAEPERDGGTRVEWGAYEPAIRRWERVLGRPAPRPTEPGRTGERLNPRFVEWMQGLAEGHVTDILSRNPALKALGNGVVPQQAALALRVLLPRLSEVAA